MRKRHAAHPGAEKAERSFDLEDFYRTQGIHPKWTKCRITDFPARSEEGRKLRRYVEGLDEYVMEGMGLYISGLTGSGKSHAVFSLYHHLLTETKYDAKVHFFDTLLSTMFLSFQDGRARSTFTRMYRDPKVLFIEDFGSELAKSDRTTPAKAIQQIIKSRSMLGKPTVITSKLDPEEIKDTYGPDISSLMREHFFTILLSDVDHRKSRHL